MSTERGAGKTPETIIGFSFDIYRYIRKGCPLGAMSRLDLVRLILIICRIDVLIHFNMLLASPSLAMVLL